VSKALAKRLLGWRTCLKLSRREAARCIGIPEGAYARLERGKPVVTVDAVLRVRALTGFPLDLIAPGLMIEPKRRTNIKAPRPQGLFDM
jgi:transcriptional regulator with XRE-family HTH domain